MAVLHLSDIHAARVECIRATWTGGPSSDAPAVAVFAPMLVAVYRDRKKQTKERVMVANTPEERARAAEALGAGLGREGFKPFAVTQAVEAWMAPDDGGGTPSARADRTEVLSVSTAQADGRTLSTIIQIARSEGGEAALGGVVVDAEAGFETVVSLPVPVASSSNWYKV